MSGLYLLIVSVLLKRVNSLTRIVVTVTEEDRNRTEELYLNIQLKIGKKNKIKKNV